MISALRPKPSLAGMDRREIQEALGGRLDARLRAAQIAGWIYARAASSFDEMTNLPAALRAELEDRFTVSPIQIAQRLISTDSVQKLLIHSGDDNVYECVLLPYEDRISCCISSQVGCPMGCAFCATGLGGFDRNLSAGEIVGQYLELQRLARGQGLGFGVQGSGCEPSHSTLHTPHAIPPTPNSTLQTPNSRISHVVFMGMGEPLLNLPNVLKALRLLHDEVGLSYRHMTISTVGIVPQIIELAKLKLPIHLALSLHSPFDEIRNRLMPVNKRWAVAETVDAMKQYQKATGRKITIEYLLIAGLTDTRDQAAELARLMKGVPSVINLIPFNYVDTEQGFARPERKAVREFKNELKKRGVNVTERMERGHDIAAACGQLAGEHKGRFARRGKPSAMPAAAG